MATNRSANALTASGSPSAARTLFSSAQKMEEQGQLEEARFQYEQALSMLRAGEGVLGCTIARAICRIYYSAGEIDVAFDCAELSLAMALANADQRSIALSLNSLGTLHQVRGALDEAEFFYMRAESHAQAIGDAELIATMQLNRGTIANIRGEFEMALACYESSLAGFRAAGNEKFIGGVLNNLGLLYGDLGRMEQAESVYKEALIVALRRGDRHSEARVLMNLADLYVSHGRIEEAEKACSAAESLVKDEYVGSRIAAEWRRVMAVVQREMGNFARSEVLFQEALESAERRGDLLMLAEGLREQAILFSRQNRNRETLQSFNRSRHFFLQLRARKDIADLEEQLEELEQTFLTIVLRWGESIEAADHYTQGHCVRVADYACTLARAVGLESDNLLWFRMGALLHDVGKMGVPSEILNKPGGLTPDERLALERHPDVGVDLLEGIDFPWDIRPMVRFHHERWEGGGYPTGVAGEEIPLAARILAIADVFDALSTDRPYRKALPVEQCLEMMCREMRGHFEPALLETFVALCRSGALGLPPGA